MKVLFLVQKEQRIILDRLYEAVANHCECDLRWLTSDEQADLRRYFRDHVEVDRYDRIIFFLRFKKEMKQVAFIRSLPNLVILEHDAYQNFIPCKYTGKFSRHYQRLPGVRVLSSGAAVTQRLVDEGFDAIFVPKGYDQSLLHDLNLPRDIELGFVGSLGSVAYSGRREMLEAIRQVEPLQIIKTRSGDEYLQTLNRIRFFASADVGMGEYMIKNFEAMACGCVLFAFRQGKGEEETLGFEDMKNIVLYSTLEEFREKLAHLRLNPTQADEIARAGQALVTSRYSFAAIGKTIIDVISTPLNPRPPLRWIEQQWARHRFFLF